MGKNNKKKIANSENAPMKDGTELAHMLPENVEINLMYLMAYAIWLLADDAERRMAAKAQGFLFLGIRLHLRW